MTPDVRVFPDPARASRALAAELVEQIRIATEQQGRCTLVLSGGSTPRPLYERLATRYVDAIPWALLHVFWGDERYAPPASDESNLRMAREALLSRVPIPAANVHPMPTDHDDPEDAARAYEEMLRSFFGGEIPRFDVVLLGLGADGHTASLFPGSSAVDEKDRWVAASKAPAAPRHRLTLTLPVLNRAARVHFIVVGERKAEVVRRILKEPPDAVRYPASAVRPTEDALTWWLDRAAARGL